MSQVLEHPGIVTSTVHITGNQTIAGNKTFTGNIYQNGYSVLTQKDIFSASDSIRWNTSTIIGQTAYTFSTDTYLPFPSSTPSDYLVFYGAGKLGINDYTINTTTNTITFVDSPQTATELSIQYIGTRVLDKPTVVTDTTSTTIDLSNTLAQPNTEYVYGELTSFSFGIADGEPGDYLNIIFQSGSSTATTLTVNGTNLAYKSFVPGTDKYVEISAKWYGAANKWLVLFHQIPRTLS